MMSGTELTRPVTEDMAGSRSMAPGLAVSPLLKDVLETARSQRVRRQLAARQLFALTLQLDPVVASGMMQELAPVALDDLPAWCLMDDASLRDLMFVTGALFVAPALRHCIDGRKLSRWRELLGRSLFDEILASVERSQVVKAELLSELSECSLLANGASILSTTINGHPASLLLLERLGGEHSRLVDHQLAHGIYHQALAIHQKLQTGGNAETVRPRRAEADSVEMAGVKP